MHTNHDLPNEKKICDQNHTHDLIDERFDNKADADLFLYNSKLDGRHSIRNTYTRKNIRVTYHKCRCTDLRYVLKRECQDTIKDQKDCKAEFQVREVKDLESDTIEVTVEGSLISDSFPPKGAK